MASSYSQQSILFHNFHLCLVELSSVVPYRLSRIDGIIWKLTCREAHNFEKLNAVVSELRRERDRI